MHHANLPIKIIIKRYLSLAGRGGEEVGEMKRPTTYRRRLLLVLRRQAVIFDVRKSGKKPGNMVEEKEKEARTFLPPHLLSITIHIYIYIPGEIYRVNLEEESWTERTTLGRNGEGVVEEEEEGVEGEEGRKRGAFEAVRRSEILEAKPVITRLPGATAADCYLVSTPTTLSPAILLSWTY